MWPDGKNSKNKGTYYQKENKAAAVIFYAGWRNWTILIHGCGKIIDLIVA